MLLALATLAGFAHAACPSGKSASPQSLSAATTKAELAFAEMDEDGFRAAHVEVEAAFACLSDRLNTDEVVAYHRHEALSAFLAGRERETVESLQAATRVFGGDILPSSIAPAGTALRDLYDDAWHDVPRDTESFATGKRTVVYIDGKRTSSRPTRTAALVQVEDTNGRLIYTGYLHADDPLPPEITEAAKVVEEYRTGVHYGFEAGLPLGGRVEFALPNNYVEVVAIRVGFNGAPGSLGTPVYGLMVAAAVDVPLGYGDFDFEFTFGGFIGNVGPYLIGGAAQYDPAGPFQLNLGIDLTGVAAFNVPMADINAQWVW